MQRDLVEPVRDGPLSGISRDDDLLRKIDAKGIFHYLKALKAANLVGVKGVMVRVPEKFAGNPPMVQHVPLLPAPCTQSLVQCARSPSFSGLAG